MFLALIAIKWNNKRRSNFLLELAFLKKPSGAKRLGNGFKPRSHGYTVVLAKFHDAMKNREASAAVRLLWPVQVEST